MRDHLAQVIGSLPCTTVERNIPKRDQILIAPSTPAAIIQQFQKQINMNICHKSVPYLLHLYCFKGKPVRRPAPSGLQRAEEMAAAWADTIFSARAFLFRSRKRPSLLEISNESEFLASMDLRLKSNQCKSVAIKSNGNLATKAMLSLSAFHLWISQLLLID